MDLTPMQRSLLTQGARTVDHTVRTRAYGCHDGRTTFPPVTARSLVRIGLLVYVKPTFGGGVYRLTEHGLQQAQQ